MTEMRHIRRTAFTALLANGCFPTHPEALGALRAAERIVCCDGAADNLIAAGLEPDWIVGDLDSLSEASRRRFAGRAVRVGEQESNDLSKAFRFCVTHGWTELTVLGATGLREDHTLANLSLLADFAREASVVALTDTGVFVPLLAPARLAAAVGQQISLFALESGTRVSGEGFKYPLRDLCLRRWWQAALNEAAADAVELTFQGGPLLVFLKY